MPVKLGGQVNVNTKLETLNGGQGVQRGKIRITDRVAIPPSLICRSATPKTLQAINGNANISVRASVSGDRFVLEDLTDRPTPT
jgi:hypothetical protein